MQSPRQVRIFWTGYSQTMIIARFLAKKKQDLQEDFKSEIGKIGREIERLAASAQRAARTATSASRDELCARSIRHRPPLLYSRPAMSAYEEKTPSLEWKPLPDDLTTSLPFEATLAVVDDEGQPLTELREQVSVSAITSKVCLAEGFEKESMGLWSPAFLPGRWAAPLVYPGPRPRPRAAPSPRLARTSHSPVRPPSICPPPPDICHRASEPASPCSASTAS